MAKNGTAKAVAKPAVGFNLLATAIALPPKPKPSWVDRLPSDLKFEIDGAVTAMAAGQHVPLESLARALLDECQSRKIDVGVKSQSITRYFRDRVASIQGAR